MKTGTIYKATSPSGKIYIGQTIQTFLKRKNRHHSNAFNISDKAYNYPISRAIRKYGDDIKWTILYSNIQTSNLNKLEIEEIRRYNSFCAGYNSTLGGEGSSGYILSIEARRKMSEAHKGNRLSAKTRKKISKAQSGKHHSKETKKKMSETRKGKNHPFYGKHHSTETREKISKTNMGKKHSIETKKKMSGENSGNAKLNFKKVQEIRIKYITKKYTYTKLAKEYNVNRRTISRVVNYLSWSDPYCSVRIDMHLSPNPTAQHT